MNSSGCLESYFQLQLSVHFDVQNGNAGWKPRSTALKEQLVYWFPYNCHNEVTSIHCFIVLNNKITQLDVWYQENLKIKSENTRTNKSKNAEPSEQDPSNSPSQVNEITTQPTGIPKETRKTTSTY